MLLRRSASSGASETLRGAEAVVAADAAPEEVAFDADDSDLPIPNWPDIKICAAIPSCDFSCAPRVFWPAAAASEEDAGKPGVRRIMTAIPPWQGGAPDTFIPTNR